jgi:hypothetical protein
MEAYGRRYVDLALEYKRMKAKLDQLRQSRDQMKGELYKIMIKTNTTDVEVNVKVNGKDEKFVLNREKIRPKPKTQRKKKSEVEEDIATVLENHGIDRAHDLVKEIEQARKAKGDAKPTSARYGDVVYE